MLLLRLETEKLLVETIELAASVGGEEGALAEVSGAVEGRGRSIRSGCGCGGQVAVIASKLLLLQPSLLLLWFADETAAGEFGDEMEPEDTAAKLTLTLPGDIPSSADRE